MIRILKQSRHDFCGKYVMDIVWILSDVYMEVEIYGFVKVL